MRMRSLLPIVGLLWLSAVTAAPAASTQADFNAALAAAQEAENDAGTLKNQWTTTKQTLTAAQKAAAAGNFDTAVSEAKHAEALAKASIAQAKEQQDAWRAAVVR
jgi:hypothetical protein